MYFTTALISLIAALGVSAAPLSSSSISPRTESRPVTHLVEVGKNGLTYTPPFITAKPGDLVQLNFFAKNHTFVQSSFADPCTPLVNGLFAGFQPSNITVNSTGFVTFKTVTFEVGTSSPLWFYCAQANHCQSGMTFAINPPPGSVETFDKVAATKTENIAPYGGPVGVVEGLEEVFIEDKSTTKY
jgi:plastocyanin